MRIYVDELPKSCGECPCCNNDVDYGSCCNLGAYEYDDYHQTTTRHHRCPLQTIAEHDKQVRKKVCEKIYRNCEPLFRLVNNYDNGDIIERNELVDILDQIQGETK